MATQEALTDLPDPVREPSGPCLMVIFGAAGDLTKRKLMPALYNLAKAQLLPKEFAVVGVARNEMTTEVFREKLRGYGMTPTEDPEVLWNFEKFVIDRSGNVVARFDPNTTPEDPALLAAIDKALG